MAISSEENEETESSEEKAKTGASLAMAALKDENYQRGGLALSVRMYIWTTISLGGVWRMDVVTVSNMCLESETSLFPL